MEIHVTYVEIIYVEMQEDAKHATMMFATLALLSIHEHFKIRNIIESFKL